MLYMCDFELEYNLSMHVYRYTYLYIRASNDATVLKQTSWIPSYIAGGGGDFRRKSTNFKRQKSRAVGWLKNLLLIKNAPGEASSLGALGGGPVDLKQNGKKTRVNKTHLDQRLVNGLFHLYL